MAPQEFQREIAIMKKLEHVNVVNLLEVISDADTDKLYLVEEYVENGPIMTESEYTAPIKPALAWYYFRDICKGLEYLHAQRIYHRDLKPSNILVARDGTCKISGTPHAAAAAARITAHCAYPCPCPVHALSMLRNRLRRRSLLQGRR